MELKTCLPPSLHLSHSVLFSLVLLMEVFISWFASSYGACSDTFTCGDYVFYYPFGRRNSGCGDPALQLDCDYERNVSLITISGDKYYILYPYKIGYSVTNYLEGTITISGKSLWGDTCHPSSSNNTAQFWSSNQFHIADRYRNISLWRDCNANSSIWKNITVSPLECNYDCYYNLASDVSSTICDKKVKLPVMEYLVPGIEQQNLPMSGVLQTGFEINWNVSKICTDCDSSKGICAYYNSSQQFYCNCSNTLYPDKCPTGSYKRIIILGVALLTVAFFMVAFLLLVLYIREGSSVSKELQLCVGLEPARNSKSVWKVENFLRYYIHEMPTRCSYSQLKKITNNFAYKLGEGGFGVVYKGKLESGDLVAVKMLDQSRHSKDQFMNEVATIGRIHHVHLVRLMGYCFEGSRSALIYEYMPNGSLEKFIFAGKEKKHILNWERLYSIALGAARGIAYLHQDCHRRIIHFDIKPHNILLDEAFKPKVADFGLAQNCGKGEDHISMTTPRGTVGYAAPELWSRDLGPVTDKADVYSFGMVLLEMVGGRKNIDVWASRSSQFYFPRWAFKLLEKGELETRLRSEQGKAEIECQDQEKVRKLVKVGLWCFQHNSIDRPSMSRVIQMLERNGDDVSNTPLPFHSSPDRQAPFLSSIPESS